MPKAVSGFTVMGLAPPLQILVYNTDLDLVRFVKSAWEKVGCAPLGPYLDKEKGTITSKYKIERRKDYWKVVVARFEQAQSLFRRLSLRHREKLVRKQIAHQLSLGDKWLEVVPRVRKFIESIKAERDGFVKEAERKFLQTHASPT
jgi:hypothetical protein